MLQSISPAPFLSRIATMNAEMRHPLIELPLSLPIATDRLQCIDQGALNMTKLGFRVKELMGGLDWWKRDAIPRMGKSLLYKPDWHVVAVRRSLSYPPSTSLLILPIQPNSWIFRVKVLRPIPNNVAASIRRPPVCWQCLSDERALELFGEGVEDVGSPRCRREGGLLGEGGRQS